MPVVQKPKAKQLSSQSIVSRLMALTSVEPDVINMLVYGHSGTGKTRFMSTFNHVGKVLHIVCSGNGISETKSIRGVKNIDAIELEDPFEIPDLVKFAENNNYKTIALDHVTEYCRVVLSKHLKRDIPEILSWGTATQQQWGVVSSQVTEMMKELISFNGHTLILGQQRTYDSVEEAGEIVIPYVSVAATPAVAGWLAPACDFIVQTHKGKFTTVMEKKVGDQIVRTETTDDKVSYLLRTGPSEVYMTKFRVPPGVELPDVVKDPSYKKLQHLLEA